MDRGSYWNQEQHNNNNNQSTSSSSTVVPAVNQPPINIQQVKFESPEGGESRPGSACREDQSIFRYCEGNLNFATVATDDDEYGFQKKKALARDPMSHRIIEKRRRDRMNNCLADLSRLIPADYLKKGRGRVEKTEIIEMAIKHMKHLQGHACTHLPTDSSEVSQEGSEQPAPIVAEHYRLGFQECLSETMHFLVEVEGFFAGDSLCVQLINHLQQHCEKITKGDRLNFPRPHRDASMGSSRGYGGYSGGPSSNSSGSDSGGNGHSSKENNPAAADWRRSEADDTPSPHPLAQQTLPPPPPPPPASVVLSELEDSLMSLPSESGEPSSQLRDMLTSTASAPRRAPDSDCGSLYKFKNNIKQRFTAEHHDEKRRRVESDTGLALIKQRNSPSPTLQSTESTPTSNCSNSPTQSYGVPVFALHTKGSFYIPLTIDNEMLAPYMGAFGDHNQVLHPVTISVNFCGVSSPVQIPTQQAAPMIPWRGDPPGLVPLPKWSVCDRA